MLQDLLKPHFHLGSFLLRLGLATIFIFHGFLKLAQGDGANWHDAAHNVLTAPAQIALTWGEMVCGFAMLLGLLSRLAAVGIVTLQMGAIMLETWRLDFIHIEYVASRPSWTRTGYEYNFALILMSLAVLAIGSGYVSLDFLIFGRMKDAAPPAVPKHSA